MDNKEDWKKIEEYMDNRNAEMMSKYKIDINQDIGKKVEQSKKNKKRIKILIIIVTIILIYSVIYSIYDIWASNSRKDKFETTLGEMVIETAVKTDIFGNGCYSYKVVGMPDAEIHAWFVIYKDIFIEDSDERLCKYYFERWEDDEKNKFIINESYDDCSGFLYKKKNWILNYKMYIEVSNFEEAMEAINTIIRFKEYSEDKVFFGSNVYIKAGTNIIVPQISSLQSNESMREYVSNESLKIFEK